MKKIILLLMIIGLTGCQKEVTIPTTAKLNFDEFIDTQYTNALKDNYLTMHYGLINIDDYGINRENIDVNLGNEFSDGYVEETLTNLKETKDKLKQFEYDTLSSTNQQTYDILNYQLELEEAALNDKFRYIDNVFSPMSGLQSQLPTLFSDYSFYNEQDIKDVIILMNDTKRYVDEALEYTKKQKELGYMMSNQNIDSVIAYCNKIIELQENSSILSSLNQSIEEFNNLNAKQKADYQQQIKEAFNQSFLPAYQDIVNTLTSLKDDKNNTMGLAHLETGKEYYEYLFKVKTGSDKTILEMKSLLLDLANASLSNVQSLVLVNPNLYDDYLNDLTKTKYTDFNTMLQDLNEWSKSNFPTINEVQYNIEALPTETANAGVAAYYTISPIDNTQPDNIRVNMTNNEVNDISTFKTVAHEGFPGHMYQNNFVKQNMDTNFRKSSQFLGYTEGYATYVELESINALDISNDLKALVTNLEIYQNCLVAMLDIGIHYEGWTLDMATSYLDDYGLNADASESIYQQIQSNPGSFLSYYVGYAEIRNLKDWAKNELGDNFDELGFNTALLKSGSVPFKIVKENIALFIQEKKQI